MVDLGVEVEFFEQFAGCPAVFDILLVLVSALKLLLILVDSVGVRKNDCFQFVCHLSLEKESERLQVVALADIYGVVTRSLHILGEVGEGHGEVSSLKTVLKEVTNVCHHACRGIPHRWIPN